MKLKGKLESFNFSPKGGYEGLLLSTSKGVVQVNFSPEFAAQIQEAIPLASLVNAEVSAWEEDDRKGDHPVYHLVSIAPENGAPISLDPASSVQGRVERMNFAKHGELNGVVLDTGDFIHLKPHGMKLVQPVIGQLIHAKGPARRLQFSDKWVIEAETVDGKDIESKKHHPAKKAAKKASAKK